MKSETRICTRCNIEHPLTSEFFWKQTNLRDGFRYFCKDCGNKNYKPHPIERNPYYKKCSDCGVTYPRTLDYFYKVADAFMGIGGVCKKCFLKRTEIWHSHNIEKVKATNIKFKKTHAKEIALSEYKRRRFKYATDPNFKIRCMLSCRLRKVLKGRSKSDKTLNLLGCDIPFFMSWIESQFSDGMGWNNYGKTGWHLDHIRPCASFDLADPEQQKQCFHFSNFQPLWGKDNIKKGSFYNGFIYYNGEIFKKKTA